YPTRLVGSRSMVRSVERHGAHRSDRPLTYSLSVHDLGTCSLYVSSRAKENPAFAGLSFKRLKGLEPSTFCMASRRSSQLSYSRAVAASIATGPGGSGPKSRLGRGRFDRRNMLGFCEQIELVRPALAGQGDEVIDAGRREG